MWGKLQRLYRRVRGCPMCGRDRHVLHFGSGLTADLRTCRWCTGRDEKVSDTMHLTAWRDA